MTKDLKRIFKPEVTALRAYSLEPHETSIKINQNENPWETPEKIKGATLRQFENYRWSRYPPFISSDLEMRLAAFAGWKPNGVLAGNGSNELIQALLMVTIAAGKSVLISEPTFTLYRQVATILGGEVLSVRMTPDFLYDVGAIIESIEEHKPSALIVGKLVDAISLITRDDEIVEALPGEQVGVWAKPGMSALKNLAGMKVFMFQDGEIDTGKPNPMKIFEVLSKGKGKPLPVTDSRKKSKASTHFLTTDTSVEKASQRQSGDDFDDDDSFEPGEFDS